jgi:putative solute:sodium symporter small subunit
MTPRRRVAAVQIALDPEHRVALGELKNGLLTMLAVWIAYFVIVKLFGDALDRIAVPVIGLPLGAFLVMQGTLVMFLAALVFVVRRLHGPTG